MASQAARPPYFLTSQRLGFGLWTEDDAGLAAGVWGDDAVTRWTGGPFTPAQVQARLDTEISNGRHHDVQYWPIFRLEDGAHVGCCGLRPRAVASEGFELGYSLRRDAWGQGYAAEAAQAVIDWATARGMPTLIAGHNPENHTSARILRGLGFVYTHDEIYPPTGQMEPCYALNLAPPTA